MRRSRRRPSSPTRPPAGDIRADPDAPECVPRGRRTSRAWRRRLQRYPSRPCCVSMNFDRSRRSRMPYRRCPLVESSGTSASRCAGPSGRASRPATARGSLTARWRPAGRLRRPASDEADQGDQERTRLGSGDRRPAHRPSRSGAAQGRRTSRTGPRKRDPGARDIGRGCDHWRYKNEARGPIVGPPGHRADHRAGGQVRSDRIRPREHGHEDAVGASTGDVGDSGNGAQNRELHEVQRSECGANGVVVDQSRQDDPEHEHKDTDEHERATGESLDGSTAGWVRPPPTGVVAIAPVDAVSGITDQP